MAILELLYNKDVVVRTQRRKPREIIPLGEYRNGHLRRMVILDSDTVSIQEHYAFHTEEHAYLSGEDINRVGGIVGHIWENFRREYIWTPDSITPDA